MWCAVILTPFTHVAYAGRSFHKSQYRVLFLATSSLIPRHRSSLAKDPFASQSKSFAPSPYSSFMTPTLRPLEHLPLYPPPSLSSPKNRHPSLPRISNDKYLVNRYQIFRHASQPLSGQLQLWYHLLVHGHPKRSIPVCYPYC